MVISLNHLQTGKLVVVVVLCPVNLYGYHKANLGNGRSFLCKAMFRMCVLTLPHKTPSFHDLQKARWRILSPGIKERQSEVHPGIGESTVNQELKIIAFQTT